jgi:ABC-type transport system involved in cytochrome c biogenesis permease component
MAPISNILSKTPVEKFEILLPLLVLPVYSPVPAKGNLYILII